jgi:hypothetical protein
VCPFLRISISAEIRRKGYNFCRNLRFLQKYKISAISAERRTLLCRNAEVLDFCRKGVPLSAERYITLPQKLKISAEIRRKAYPSLQKSKVSAISAESVPFSAISAESLDFCRNLQKVILKSLPLLKALRAYPFLKP